MSLNWLRGLHVDCRRIRRMHLDLVACARIDRFRPPVRTFEIRALIHYHVADYLGPTASCDRKSNGVSIQQAS